MATAVWTIRMHVSQINTPRSHPFLACLCITAERFDELGFLMQDRHETKLVWIHNNEPAVHRFFVACSTDRIRRELEARWA